MPPIQESFEVGPTGRTIRGTAYRPDGWRRGPAVLMLHGFTGNRLETGYMFVTLGRALARRGMAAVTFDCRHCGESDGSFEQMLATGLVEDTITMTRWMQTRVYADRSRLAVLGFSLGGLMAACSAPRVDPWRTMVLLAPTTVENLCRYAARAESSDPVTVGPHELHPRLFDDLRTLDPLGDIVTKPRPTLVVQGAEDKAVPPDVSRQYVDRLEAGRIEVKLEMVPEADHGFSRRAARQQLVRLVGDWLAARL